MSCARDSQIADLAAICALVAGVDSVHIIDDPENPRPKWHPLPGACYQVGTSIRNGNLNGHGIILEILTHMRNLAVFSGAGRCLKIDSDTVLLDIERFAAGPHGRNRETTGAFFGAAYSLDLAQIERAIAGCQSEKIHADAPEDVTIWTLAGCPVVTDSEYALAPFESYLKYPCPPDAVTCGNPNSDGTRRSPKEILKRMQSVVRNRN